MKISTKGRYAVRVMLDLALNDTGEYVKVREIAKRQEISEKYLEQIIAVLNKAVKVFLGSKISPAKVLASTSLSSSIYSSSSSNL